MSHAFINKINIAKLKNRTRKRDFLLQTIQNWKQIPRIPMRIQWIQWIQHPPIIAERDDNDENYDLTQISYKWVLNLRSDHDNGSEIFHGGSLQTNDRKDWHTDTDMSLIEVDTYLWQLMEACKTALFRVHFTGLKFIPSSSSILRSSVSFTSSWLNRQWVNESKCGKNI